MSKTDFRLSKIVYKIDEILKLVGQRFAFDLLYSHFSVQKTTKYSQRQAFNLQIRSFFEFKKHVGN
ncbi:MAG: hypothetical protein COZ18_00690 [Flexibacter sp. CG_4_10_14_3_um_filter_32_15]|nr:MAG: hypothetical protein COZ18_00690 [Flexibacter sp. CG_4_10_14_3_um_filter_32_15]